MPQRSEDMQDDDDEQGHRQRLVHLGGSFLQVPDLSR